MDVTLCVLLWANEGREEQLVAYEDLVLGFLANHGGQVLSRVRRNDDSAQPFEVQVLRFPSELALQNFMNDPARTALSRMRDEAVAATEILRVDQIPD